MSPKGFPGTQNCSDNGLSHFKDFKIPNTAVIMVLIVLVKMIWSCVTKMPLFEVLHVNPPWQKLPGRGKISLYHFHLSLSELLFHWKRKDDQFSTLVIMFFVHSFLIWYKNILLWKSLMFNTGIYNLVWKWKYHYLYHWQVHCIKYHCEMKDSILFIK